MDALQYVASGEGTTTNEGKQKTLDILVAALVDCLMGEG